MFQNGTRENWTPSSLVVWLKAAASTSLGLSDLPYCGSHHCYLICYPLNSFALVASGRPCVLLLWPLQHCHRLGVYYHVVLEAGCLSYNPGKLQGEFFSPLAAMMAAGIAQLVTAWLQALPSVIASSSSSPPVSSESPRKSRMISFPDLPYSIFCCYN